MKKSFYLQVFILAIVFALIGSFSAYSQDKSAGPIPKMKSDRYNIQKTISSTAPLTLLPGDMAYGYDGANTITMPMPAGTPFTTLAAWAAPNFAASAVRGHDGNYYVLDVGPLLFQLDPVTGSTNLIGPITGMGTDTPNGISYNPVDGNYYLVSSNNLYQLDIVTLAATLIGPLNNGAGVMIDLCIASDGTCYAYDLGNDDGGTINLTTGNYTLLGPLGYDANYGSGMDIDQITGDIYISGINNTTVDGELRQMSPIDGSTVVIVNWGYAVQIAPFAINNEYPALPGPGYATNPYPVWNAFDILLDEDLSWTNPGGVTDVEVFFGTDPATLPSVQSGIATTYDPGTMAYQTTYYWRVNETDGSGTTIGTLWSFTTEVAPCGHHLRKILN